MEQVKYYLGYHAQEKGKTECEKQQLRDQKSAPQQWKDKNDKTRKKLYYYSFELRGTNQEWEDRSQER